MYKIIALILALVGPLAIADELVIIQAVSTDQRTFVIAKGHREGIGRGQESLFSTTKISLVARAIEVNREYSLWSVIDDRANIPFEKEEMVNYSNTVESIEIQIPEVKIRRNQIFFQPKKFWYMRTGFSRTLSQTISDAPSDTDKYRQGMQFDALFTYNWKPKWEWGIGVRYDVEAEVLEQGDVTVPSSRFLLTSEILYQLEYFKGKKSNFYISGSLGVGRSQTQVTNFISTGWAFVIPTVRVGWQRHYHGKWWFLLEGLMESVKTEESFTDTDPQETNLTNMKILMGIKF
jgi:hypothetical protein